MAYCKRPITVSVRHNYEKLLNTVNASKRHKSAILITVAGDAGQSLRHRRAGFLYHALQVARLLLQQHVGMIEFLYT